MKKLITILIIIFSLFLATTVNALDDDGYFPTWNNVPTWNTKAWETTKNQYMNDLRGNGDINMWENGEKSVRELLYVIARDVKTIMYIIAWVYFLIITIRLLMAWNTEEASGNWKKWIIWTSLWIVVMQIAYSYVEVLYLSSGEVWWTLASNFSKYILENIVKLLETATSFVFVIMMIFAFYAMITSNWDEEKYKNWTKTVIYAIIWFIVVKLAKELVYAVYWEIDCGERTVLWIFQISGSSCTAESDLTWISNIVVRIINWMNGFVWILVIIMIIYAWFQIIFWNWEEEKLKKAKSSIIYITIWIAILVMNYFILTFFIKPEISI
jgi:hypothetical protein